jgi:hypothetical protein
MDWESILKTLGGTTAMVAAIAWLARSVVRTIIDRDLERFRSLHAKRSELLAELYQKLVLVQSSINRMMWEYRDREIREQVERESPSSKREPWDLKPGFELLSGDEEACVKGLSDSLSDFSQFFAKNRIFFPVRTCEVIDRFALLSGFLSINYRNVTFKDSDGNLYVNPQVKKTWDAATNTIPQLLKDIEAEFRGTLGSSK